MTFVTGGNMGETLLAQLTDFYLFEGLSGAQLQPILRQARCHHFQCGDYLFRQGDSAERAWLLTAGDVRVYRWTPEGEEKILHRFSAGEIVAQAAMFMRHGRYPSNARAECEVEAWSIRREALHEICSQTPEVAMRMMQAMSERVFSLVNRVDQLSSNSAARRLVGWLREQQSHNDGCDELRISRQQLAVQLGVAPETLSRLLNRFRSDGYVCGQRGVLKISDLEGLCASVGLQAEGMDVFYPYN